MSAQHVSNLLLKVASSCFTVSRDSSQSAPFADERNGRRNQSDVELDKLFDMKRNADDHIEDENLAC